MKLIPEGAKIQATVGFYFMQTVIQEVFMNNLPHFER